ncbi:uncharacterized protein [Macaca nemestrina]|uniref:uncharacterized protein n=1 Tax=Macaca nemestrina TaxID=9545 RepID=UPI0039B93149
MGIKSQKTVELWTRAVVILSQFWGLLCLEPGPFGFGFLLDVHSQVNKVNSPWSLRLNPCSLGHPGVPAARDEKTIPGYQGLGIRNARAQRNRYPPPPPRTRRFPAKEGAGSGRGGHLWGQLEASIPALRADGPSLTPAVGGGGGASRAARKGAGPGAWRRGLGLSVPRPPPRRGSSHAVARVAANAAARRPPPWHPEPPPAAPARRAGHQQVLLILPSKYSLDLTTSYLHMGGLLTTSSTDLWRPKQA